MNFEIPKGYNIISEDEYAELLAKAGEMLTIGSAGSIQNGEVKVTYVDHSNDPLTHRYCPNSMVDAHLDDVEILVDCE